MYRLQTTPEGMRRYSFASDGVRSLYGVEPSAVLAERRCCTASATRRTGTASRPSSRRRCAPVCRCRASSASAGRRTVKWVQMLSSPTPSDEAENVRTGMMVDITARKQAEALRIERDRAESANLAKTQFLSRVSHELRTPLNAILGFAQLLDLDTSTSPKQRERVARILSSGRHLLGLVDDVLDLSSVQTGQLALDCAEVDLHAVVHEAWTMLAAAAPLPASSSSTRCGPRCRTCRPTANA